jgi:hypothetical protein
MNNNNAPIAKTIQIFGKDIELQKLTNPTLRAILSTIIAAPLTYGEKEIGCDSTLYNWSDSCDYSDWSDYL